jgi:hypothetical protein
MPLRPLFTWRSVAEAASYEIQADDSPSFDSVDYQWRGLTGTSYRPVSEMSVLRAVPMGRRYYLRIRAVDAE